MGHASARAALIYQHATRDRDKAIAAALADLIDRDRAPVARLDEARDGRAIARSRQQAKASKDEGAGL
jgi:hypothetical protein